MLSGMPACNVKPVLLVDARNVRSITERFIKSVDYPSINYLDIENLGIVDSALVGRLPSFIGMKYDGFYRNRALADRFDFDFDSTVIRICPI
jgi:hypothetical protein